MDGFEREVLQRLPLAESVLHVLAHVCQDDFLSEVFEQHRGRCYEQQLKFSTLVDLVGDALIRDAFPADDLLNVYAARWTIETMFQHITEVFCLQRLIGSTAGQCVSGGVLSAAVQYYSSAADSSEHQP